MTQGFDHLGWQPRLGTAICLVVSGIITVWLLSPALWHNVGTDARAFYAAARVAQGGGDVYDQALIGIDEAKLNRELGVTGPGRPSVSVNEYHYPPVMTVVFRAMAPLGYSWFLAALDAVLLLAGLAGFEMVLASLSWRGRWWPRAWFLVTFPMFEVLFLGNPSSLLLLAWGGALLASRRGRPALAGALLAIGLLKIPVGVPVAVALIVAAPASRVRLAAGAALGAALFALGNLAVDANGLLAWVRYFGPMASSINVHQRAVVPQCCLAGVPGVFLGLGPVAATAIAIVLVGAPLAWLLRSGALGRVYREAPAMALALVMAAALAVAPYLHSNDLVLEALPLLVLVALPLTRPNRLVLLLWALSVPVNLALALLLGALMINPVLQPFSFGVALSAATFVALVIATARLPRGSGITPGDGQTGQPKSVDPAQIIMAD
jgi:Glycosyltransferase family 87